MWFFFLGGKLVISSSTNRTKNDTPMRFKIQIPGSGFAVVAWQPELTLEEVLKIVAEKRDLDSSDFTFDWADPSAEKKNVNLDDIYSTKLGDLGEIRELKLIRNARSLFFFSSACFSQFFFLELQKKEDIVKVKVEARKLCFQNLSVQVWGFQHYMTKETHRNRSRNDWDPFLIGLMQMHVNIK